MADDSTMAIDQPLFHDLTFTIIPSPSIDIPQLTKDIASGGGKVIPFDPSSGRIEKLNGITHIVSSTSDFPDYHGALDRFIHVVKPAWIESSLKKGKAMNPRSYSPDPALFMSDVVICCGDIPTGDKEAIIGGVIALGGQHSNSLTKMVTHIVALDLDTDERCQVALQKRLRVNIVLPHWFDDCLKLGRRISEKPYTLPDPEILKNEGSVPPSKTNHNIRHATTPNPTDDPAPIDPNTDCRGIHAFNGKSIKLGADLELSDHLKGVIEGLIKAGGGKVVKNVDDADIYVCHYRDGDDYVKASQSKKDVGNLSWLYYLISHNAWTDPMRRLLHYPRPKNGIPEFADFKISISSYTGEARVYLENLVKATGATFTKTFRQDNTHLIAAHTNSEKCEAAKEWNVHIVNHLWIEESYARCKEQTLTDSRYTFFPAATNLGEVLGQTEIDRAAVEKFFFKPQPKGRKARETAQAPKRPAVTESSASLVRVPSEPVPKSSPLAPPKSKRARTGPTTTPVANRHSDEKENETPGTTGSRGAKDRAISKIHDAAPDMALFEKEMKRKGGVIHGGKRDKDTDTAGKPKKSAGRESTGSKRSFTELEEDGETTVDEIEEETATKGRKGKKAKLTPIKYRMLLSKDERWLNNAQKESTDKNKLRELGLFIVEDHKKVDLLCAPKFVRTKKFVCALAQAPTLVNTTFLDYALKHNKLPPPEKHLLVDHDFEKQHGFKMSEALERAKKNNGRLLKNWAIFCTESVVGGYETFRSIITANGGSSYLWKGGKNAVSVSKRSIDATAANAEVSQNQEEDEGDVLYLISEAKESEKKLWDKFRELAKKHDMVPRIVRTEWLLFVAMAQYVHWDSEWELSEDKIPKADKK